MNDSDTSLPSSGFVASRRAAQPAEGEERRREQAPALLAAAAGPGSASGRERGVRPLGRHHQSTRHVRLPPPDVGGLPRRRQTPQQPAASDLGGNARGEEGVASLRLYFLLGAPRSWYQEEEENDIVSGGHEWDERCVEMLTL